MADMADPKITDAKVEAEENDQVEKSDEAKAENGDKIDKPKIEVKAEAEGIYIARSYMNWTARVTCLT
jgi:hypothetical protein